MRIRPKNPDEGQELDLDDWWAVYSGGDNRVIAVFDNIGDARDFMNQKSGQRGMFRIEVIND